MIRQEGAMGPTFSAIDFETADYGRDSACSVAIIRVVDGQITNRWYRLIQPPRKLFHFTYLHGISWNDVKNSPTFAQLWPAFEEQLIGVPYMVAHNAGFDKAVLNACCTGAGIKPPVVPFKCTVQMAREAWGLYPTKLSNVCTHLKIPLIHHQADSDAEACACIALAAMGVDFRAATGGLLTVNAQ